MAKKDTLLTELKQHYTMWTEDNKKRMNRTGGWNDVTDAYYGKLPSDWPYITRVVDPRIRTSLVEKNARLLNSKLRGTLVPRESPADNLKAQTNNAVLNFQWDNAKDGGSMLSKMSICDMDARLYASKFMLVKWKYVAKDGEILFDGNEATPLDIRDCGIDPTASHIRDAKWFQHRSWEFLEDLKEQSDISGSKSVFKNIDKLESKVKEKAGSARSATRTTSYVPRGKTLRSLRDRTGEDKAFPVIKLCTEYREDKWITFAPDYDEIIRETDNPYKHKKIPVAQLKYYALQDDPLGESEVEPVLPLWKAIQAVLCGYLDEVVLKMRPPIKVIEGAVRAETIEYSPEAQWLVTRQDAVEEMRSSGDSLAYFQTTYQALVSAFNVAMGDLSQGLSNFGPFQDESKTATEIRATEKQQSTRDQKNQNDLSDFIQDIMLMWLSNNQQFLFSEPNKKEHIVRIVGTDAYAAFERAGLGEMEILPEALQMIGDIVERSPDMGDNEITTLYGAAATPRFPVVENPGEKDPTKLKVKAKMRKKGDTEVDLSVLPEDLEGLYDYKPDVQSMSIGAGKELELARTNAIELLTTNQLVLQLLREDGYRPAIKELIQSDLESKGFKNAERFFKEIKTQEGTNQMGGAGQAGGVPGVQGIPQAPTGAGVPQPMAGPVGG